MSEMTKAEMKRRTKQFALRVIRLASALPDNAVGRVIANQIIRSGTSVGANYRAILATRSVSFSKSQTNRIISIIRGKLPSNAKRHPSDAVQLAG